MERSLGRLLHSVPNGYGRTVVGGREIITKPSVAPSENDQSIIDRINSAQFSPDISPEHLKYANAAIESWKNDIERDLPDLMQKARDFSSYVYDNPDDTVSDIVNKGYVNQSMLNDIGFTDKNMTMRDYARKQLDMVQDHAYKGIDLEDPRNKKLILDLISEQYIEY